ncbi:Transposable element tcb2 transposase [Caligus rogercresseyi]|uniref:Transposable element tcb2 transposase n=1 Tax=Caligus rogercresseyi TaxID=217165 RepID=A0A7T8HIW1_CALRO|nr:Transposable element tcb2 transposase [Caligus rogercresseyi]
MNVDEKTIRTAVYEDPRSKTYVLKVRQMLSEVSKAKIGSRTICPCSGRRRYGPLARRTATR